MILKILFTAFSFAFWVTALAQTCSYTPVLSSNGATCLQEDTLKLSGGNSASSITWYRGLDSVGIATLAPFTVAGRKTGNGSGSTAELLYEPWAICGDKYGNIYIADNINRRVQKWEPGATSGITVAGGVGYGAVNNRMVSSPFGVAVDTLGNVYVSDRDLNRVQKWAPGATQGITVAGSITGSSGTTANLLTSPMGIFVTKSGSLYITDLFNYRVQLWLPNASSGITVAGGNGYGSADNQISFPTSVYVDDNENVFVVDNQNHRVQKWAPGAQAGITVAGGNGIGSASNQLNYPWGITADADGIMYISDRGNHRIQKWLPGAVSGITVAGGDGAGNNANQLASPSSVWLDSSKNIFISDVENNRIQKWTPGTTEGITVAGSKIGAARVYTGPNAIAFDKYENMYVTDGITQSVIKFQGGAINGVIVAGGNGQGKASNQFSFPGDLFVDNNDVIYVSDGSNNRVQKWLPGADTGITVAGGNGPGNAANQLSGPRGVYVDIQGNVFVADYTNHRVQKWAPGAAAGVTVAGGNGFGNQPKHVTYPIGLVVSKTGDLYVTDAGNQRVQKWVPGATEGITIAGGGSGNASGSAANQLNRPSGLFLDDSLNLLIADYHNHRIQQWVEGADTGITIAGSSTYYGSLHDQLLGPYSIYKDKQGNLVICDMFNIRVQKWPRVVDTTFRVGGPGIYSAVVTGKNPVCNVSSNTVTVSTGYKYEFKGNGNWSSPANWSMGNLPPNPLPPCSKIIITPLSGTTCFLDLPVTISNGANLTVAPGSNFIINGNLIIQ